MKKLVTLKNVAVLMLAGWGAYSTGLPHAVLSGASSAVEFAQKSEINRLAGGVRDIEHREMEIDDEIKSVASLAQIAGPEDQPKLDRRVNHLEARKARLFVEKGAAIEKIDGLTETQRRVIESRDIALNYAGDTETLALKLRAADQQRLVELQKELGSREAALAEIEAEQAQQAAAVETERLEQQLALAKLQAQKESERAERLRLEREILEVLRQRAAESESTSQRPATREGDVEPTAARTKTRSVNYVVVRNVRTSRTPAVFQASCRSYGTCR